MKDWVGLPAGVKFDPTDQELIEHLEAKVKEEGLRSHPLIDEFIPTIEGEDGICYTHPEKLPGMLIQYPLSYKIQTCLLQRFYKAVAHSFSLHKRFNIAYVLFGSVLFLHYGFICSWLYKALYKA